MKAKQAKHLLLIITGETQSGTNSCLFIKSLDPDIYFWSHVSPVLLFAFPDFTSKRLITYRAGPKLATNLISWAPLKMPLSRSEPDHFVFRILAQSKSHLTSEPTIKSYPTVQLRAP